MQTLPGLVGRSVNRPILVLEVMPARDEAGWAALLELVRSTGRFQPDFFSITDTGPDREAVIETSIRLVREFGSAFATRLIAHFTCGGRSEGDVFRHARELYQLGVRHLLVLRGDGPRRGPFVPHPEGFSHPDELIWFLGRRAFPFVFGAASYPVGHPQDAHDEQTWQTMRRKADAKVGFFVAQVELDHENFLTHATLARGQGIMAPIIPGSFAVSTHERLRQVSRVCGVCIPEPFLTYPDKRILLELAGEVRLTWKQAHVPSLHLCTFNDVGATHAFLSHLYDVRPVKDFERR